MRVLVLCKRRYTGKDLLSDRYGRLYELPKALASFGHQVAGLALSYRLGDPIGDSLPPKDVVDWHAGYALPWPPTYLRQLEKLVQRFDPEMVWASSDVLHVILADRLAVRMGLPLVIDLYDDYEAFGLARLPGLTLRYRRACARADALTVVTHSLGKIMATRLSRPVPVNIIGNGVAPGSFRMRSKPEARTRLGLPQDCVLIGSAGALDASRGVQHLVNAFQRIRQDRTDTRLVLAGPRDRAFRPSGIEGIIDLGVLPHEEMPWLFSALDVGVVCNRDSKFGRACYPMKLAEMIACGVPVVAASVGDVPRILAYREQCLYSPDDSVQLAQRVRSQITNPMRADPESVPTWHELGQLLSRTLESVSAARDRR